LFEIRVIDILVFVKVVAHSNIGICASIVESRGEVEVDRGSFPLFFPKVVSEVSQRLFFSKYTRYFATLNIRCSASVGFRFLSLSYRDSPFLLFLASLLLSSLTLPTSTRMTTGPALASPLRRVNTPGLYPKSKLASEWEKWSTTPNYFSTADPPLDPVRYYHEFFCLIPNDKVQEEALERLGREALLGEYNVSSNSLSNPFPIAC